MAKDTNYQNPIDTSGQGWTPEKPADHTIDPIDSQALEQQDPQAYRAMQGARTIINSEPVQTALDPAGNLRRYDEMVRAAIAGDPQAQQELVAHNTSLAMMTNAGEVPSKLKLPKDFSIISAYKSGADDVLNGISHTQLLNDLKERGAKPIAIKGSYEGVPEKSIIVPHNDLIGPEAINALGKLRDQESVIHSIGGKHKLEYLTGEKAGKYLLGEGLEEGKNLKNYSELPGGKRFSLKFRPDLEGGELIHYSPQALTEIDPAKMGTSSIAGAERSRAPTIPRSYYYEAGTEPEAMVKQSAKYLHTVKRPERILDLSSEEALPIIKAAKGNADKLEELIQSKGYSGFKNSQDTQIPNAVLLFQKQPVIKAEPIISQSEVVAPTYSRLQNLLSEKMPMSAPPEQIKGIVREIKPEELQYSGFNEFLEGKDKISKADLLNHLKENEVKINEVELGKLDENPRYILKVDKDKNAPQPYGVYDTNRVRYQSAPIAMFTSEVDASRHINRLNSKSPTKFAQYTLPGGENYREVLFTLPEKPMDPRVGASSTNYYSSHFDEPNVLAHARVNTRTDTEGNKLLFLEEVQSDWHQAGRKEGYKTTTRNRDDIDAEIQQFKHDLFLKYISKVPKEKIARLDEIQQPVGLTEITPYLTKEELEKYASLGREFNSIIDSVPDAPFKKTWHEYVLKRMLRKAADEGADKLAWTTGAQQAERYDLSKHVQSVTYNKKSNFLVAYDYDGWMIVEEKVAPDKIADYIGKEAAERLLQSKTFESGSGNPVHHIEGTDLQIGGEGMKGFYDKIIPDYLNKFGKKYGVKVETSNLPEIGSVHSIKLTPEMKRDLMTKGVPMFAAGGMVPGMADGGMTPSHDPNNTSMQAPVDASNLVNLVNPDGELVSIPADRVTDALTMMNYRQPTDEDYHRHEVLTKYGTRGQTALGVAESIGRGAIPFGLSTLAERALGVPGEDIRGREEALGANGPEMPFMTEMAGFIGSQFIPVFGQANALSKIGGKATQGIAKVVGPMFGNTPTFVKNIAQDGIKAAFEGALFQSGNELSKLYTEDPKQTAETALSNIGLAAVMTGGMGTALGGATELTKGAGALAGKANEKFIMPTFINGDDKAKFEAGDFATGVKYSDAIKPGEKAHIIDSLHEVKPNADDIRKSAIILGEANGLGEAAPILEGMISNSPVIQRADNALTHSASPIGIRRQQMYADAYRMGLEPLKKAANAESPYTKAQLGDTLKKSLVGDLEREYTPIKTAYDQMSPYLDTITVPKKSLEKVVEEIRDLREFKLAPSSPGGQLVKRVASELDNIETIGDLKFYASNLYKNIPAAASSAEHHLANVIGSKLENIQSSILNESTEGALSQSLKTADSMYKSFIEKVQTLAEQLGKSKVHGFQDAAWYINNDLTAEQIVKRLFTKDDSKFMAFMEKSFPTQFQLLKDFKKSELVEASARDGIFNSKAFLKEYNNLEPEIRDKLFSEADRKIIEASETYLGSFPKDYNPSHTAHVENLSEYFKHPIGMMAQTGKDFAMERFIKNIGPTAEPSAHQAAGLLKSTIEGFKTLQKKTRQIFDPALKISPFVAYDKQTNKKIEKMVNEFTSSPDRLFDLTEHHVAPVYQSEFMEATTRAVSYLASIKPDTTKKFALDMTPKVDATTQAKYMRAVHLAENPMQLLDFVKAGTVTDDDIKTVSTIYPSLYQVMVKSATSELANAMSKNKTIPYKTRMALSMLLRTPLDSTLTPAALVSSQMALQSGTAKGGEPQPIVKPPSQSSMKGLSKLPNIYNTPSEASLTRKLNHTR